MKRFIYYLGYMISLLVFVAFLRPLPTEAAIVRTFPDYPTGVAPIDVEQIYNFTGSTVYHTDSYLIDLTGPNRISGQVWSTNMIDLNKPFSIEMYTFLGNSLSSNVTADGITLTFRNGGPTHIGLRGSGMGVYGNNLRKAHVLEYDTYYNTSSNQNASIQDGDYDLTNWQTLSRNHVGHVAIRSSNENSVVSRHTVLAWGSQAYPIAANNWRKLVYNWDPSANNGSGVLSGSVDNTSFSLNYNIRNDVSDPTRVYWGITSSTSISAANGGQDQGIFFAKAFTGTYRVNVKKIDGENNPLENATFQLLNSSGTIIQDNLKTDTNGLLGFDLPIGDYTLREKSPPAGFQLPEKSSWILSIDKYGIAKVDGTKVDVPNNLISLEITNKLKPFSLNLKKVAENDTPLAGAEFQLIGLTNGYSAKLPQAGQTDTFVFSNLTPGDYQLTETKAPAGYATLTKPININVSFNGKVSSDLVENTVQLDKDQQTNQIDMTIKNELNPYRFTLTKTTVDGIPIIGAKFRLKGTDTLYDVQLPTDNQAISTFVFDSLKPGTYELSEIEAPKGYERIVDPLKIMIGKDGKVFINDQEKGVISDKTLQINEFSQALSNQLKPFDLIVSKKDEKGDALKGAVFQLVGTDTSYDQTLPNNGEPISTFTFTNLVPGSYTLTEVTAPEGYKKLEDEISVEITKDGKVSIRGVEKPIEPTNDALINHISLDVVNQVRLENFLFYKVNELDEPMRDVVYQLFSCQNTD